MLADFYAPLTAHPYLRTESYCEIAPCAALSPYIRCFWGTVRPVRHSDAPSLVTPDTCCDVIFTVDHAAQTVSAKFCGVNDASFFSHGTVLPGLYSRFGVRFYAWAAVAFSEESMAGRKNTALDAESCFAGLTRVLLPLLPEVTALPARIALAEDFLLRHITPERCSPLLQNAALAILRANGSVRTAELARGLHVSPRQLERVFSEGLGLPPKTFSALVRYQMLWNGLLHRRFHSVADAAAALGYSDQAHLAHDFKRFHTMSISEALRFAEKDGAFLQDGRPFLL